MYNYLDNIDAINNYINTYAEFPVETSMEKVLAEWARAKEPLYHLFGDKFILSRPVSVDKSSHALKKDMGLVREAHITFLHAFLNCLERLNSEERTTYNYVIDSLIATDTMVENEYHGQKFTLGGIQVAEGMKISKIFYKFAKKYSIDGYEEFAKDYSMALNDKKLEGNLCLSIHPLDFMTMSDNDCGWSSCMSWREYGEYRKGTIDMMNSPYAIVAYLASNKNMQLIPGQSYEWNNKKWRCLFIIHPNVITNIKAYPYRSTPLVKETLTWIKELYGGDWAYDEDYTQYRVGEVIENHDDLHIEYESDCMYNDFYNNCGSVYGYFKKGLSSWTSVNYSGQVTDMSTGNGMRVTGKERLTNERHDCCKCDKSLGTHYVDGFYLCDSCYELYTKEDYITGQKTLIDNLVFVNIKNVYITQAALNILFRPQEFELIETTVMFTTISNEEALERIEAYKRYLS